VLCQQLSCILYCCLPDSIHSFAVAGAGDGPDDGSGGGDGGPVDLLDVIAAGRPAAGGVRREGGIRAVAAAVPILEQGSDVEVEQEDWVFHEEEEEDDDEDGDIGDPPAAPPSPALPDPGGAEPAADGGSSSNSSSSSSSSSSSDSDGGGDEAAAAAAAPHAARAGPDGWPRLAFPTGSGYTRLSQNADGSWDMRAVCDICGATFSRTCKPPTVRAREGSKAFGQGRPLGKIWLWLSLAGDMPADHASNDHPPRGWDPCFDNRLFARQLALDEPALAPWFEKERPLDPRRDGADGEPLLIA
jgi:hypothetical protein